MSCEYCERDFPTRISDYVAPCDGIGIYMMKDEIIAHGRNGRWKHTVHVKINYCPMCGSKLGGSDD